MKKKQPSKGRGGKLNRSEIVHLRLGPRTRFALEIMARSQNRTVSSFLEMLVKSNIDLFEIKMLPPISRLTIPTHANEQEALPLPMQTFLQLAWHGDEAHRFIAMCFCTPHLLTFDEELLWSSIQSHDYYWCFYEQSFDNEATDKKLARINSPEGIVWEHLKDHWAWLLEGNNEAILNDLKDKNMLHKPGKITAEPGITQYIHESLKEDQIFDLYSRLKKRFDKNNAGE